MISTLRLFHQIERRRIGLQIHPGKKLLLQFKDIEVRELDSRVRFMTDRRATQRSSLGSPFLVKVVLHELIRKPSDGPS